jgi:PAS domain S-box-containing protein
MHQPQPSGVPESGSHEVLWQDGERVLSRVWRKDADGGPDVVLTVTFTTEQPTPASIERLTHEYGLRDELDAAWAVRPLELTHDDGRPLLLLEDPGGEPVDRVLGRPMEIGPFLRLAIATSAALAEIHRHGLVHKDIKPAHVFVNRTTGRARLTGFGIASRLPRERQAPNPPEVIAGTLAYMAPEQTGRMNRSIDARSDLYALGVSLYQMLTGSLPFTADDPMDWVHCHIARKPAPPGERMADVPAAVSAIIMKLLEKAAEERYQTAAGLERDLRRCHADWEDRACVDDFPLGQQDTPDRLLIPEKLYGREREVETLLAAFDRVVASGAPELVLVSGYSGIGKSSVVNELHGALVPPRGLFASGKFDQYKRDIPYATLAQAFQALVRSLLGKSDAELARWREALREALEPNGRLIADLVPELTLVIGEQPPVPVLELQQAKGRFQLAFRRFIGVFATQEHPLALFLDDLQWLDVATLDLLEDLLTQTDVRHLLLIGAYRDNEVDAWHPLLRKLAAIRDAGARVSEIKLGPLDDEHVGQLTADALRSSPRDAAPLAHLVHAKTAGNPFFVLQFLHALADEGLLAFDRATHRWSWDLDRIHAKGYADNVAALMVGKLVRLPGATQTALRALACLGNVADVATLAIVLGAAEDDVHPALRAAVQHELVQRLSGQYKFVHDRVQEAAYSGIPQEQRAATHLRIGRLLVAHSSPENRDETIFDIINHLNRGATLVDLADEREQLAEFNLIAGKRAKASTAYASALRYLAAGTALLPDDTWDRRHDLIFDLELNLAECEFLTGAQADAEPRLAMLSQRAGNTIERAKVACLQMDLHINLDQLGDAVGIGLGYLRPLGVDWSPHPTDEETVGAFERFRSQLGKLGIENPVELPVMTDPVALASLDVLVKLMAPAHYTDTNLMALTVCQAVSLSLDRGNSDSSCIAYLFLSQIFGRFGDHAGARRFGQIGYDLVEVRGLKRFQARCYVDFASMAWLGNFRVNRDIARRAFEVANNGGDLIYATHAWWVTISNRIAAGDPLADVQREAEAGVAFAQKVGFGFVVGIITTQLGLIRTLRGLTRVFGSFDDGHSDDTGSEDPSSSNPSLARIACWDWIRKLQARFLAGDYAAAIEASARARPLLWTSVSNFETAEYHFYSALSQAASFGSTDADQHLANLGNLTAHQHYLAVWAEHCPENFADRAALVGAEVARIEGRDRDAMDLYEQAIRSARLQGFTHTEALANELAARFYAERGFEKIAQVYLRDARYGYLRWGADGKVRRLDELYPQLRSEEPPLGPMSTAGPMSTIGTPVEQLDLATVIKVLQAASGEIVPEKFMDTLMRTAIEQAGAERGLLVLARGDELRIAAEAATSGDAAVVQLRDQPMTADALPESVLNYVMRARESMILDDAAAQSPFSEDPYIRQRRARSILCLPLINQADLVGALYLENNLAPRVFAPARIAVLKLLASQAAISLENTRLYADLQQREAKIRRLVESNIIGVLIWDLEGQILEANDEFLRIVGYDRADLVSGQLSWNALTPEEWLDRHRREWTPELRVAGSLQPFEKEYFRKDGSRVPVLVGVASFEESEHQGVSFVLDLTDRKRGEEALREMQMALAHNNRVATVGQLTASISHEVKQPLSAAMTNAQAALRWLSADPPDLMEVRDALRDIVDNNRRAGEIVDGLRALIKREPPRKSHLNINEVIRDVIRLARREATNSGVSIQTRFDDDIPVIEGDRVQLQQVILNLIMNAVEAMSGMAEQAREIFISTANAGAGVHVEVRDTGPGLPPDTVAQLFDAFYTTKPNGLGLGLSICRSIVEAHGGLLRASNNVPHGAVFRFTLTDRPGPAA